MRYDRDISRGSAASESRQEAADRDPREFALFRFFTRQHVFTNLVTIFVLLIGTVLAFTITKEAFPAIDFDMVVIATPLFFAASFIR